MNELALFKKIEKILYFVEILKALFTGKFKKENYLFDKTHKWSHGNLIAESEKINGKKL